MQDNSLQPAQAVPVRHRRARTASMAKSHRLIGFETRRQPLLSRPAFAWRLARNFAAASALIFVSLFAGMIGYRYTEKMEWIDAFVNAAMILSGMGPLTPMQTWNGK